MTKIDIVEKLLAYIKAVRTLIEMSEMHVGKAWMCEACTEDSHETFVEHLAHLVSCELSDHEEELDGIGDMTVEYYKAAFDNAANLLEVKAELSELESELNDYILKYQD